MQRVYQFWVKEAILKSNSLVKYIGINYFKQE
jgi:hypothetical protein